MDNGNCKPYLISIKNLIFILLCAFYSCTRFKFVLFAAVVAERAARFFLSAIFDFRSKGAPRGSFSCSEVFGRQTDLACFLTEYRVRRPVDLLARSPFFVSASVLRFPLGLWLRAQYFRSRFFLLARCWQNLVFGPPFRFSVSSPGLVFDSAPPELFSCSFSRLAAASPPALILAAGARSSIPAAAARFLFAAARTRFPQQDFCAARDCFGARQSNLISCRSHSADFLRLPALSSSSPSQPSSSTAAAEDFSIRLVLGSAAGTRSPRPRHADLFPAHSLPP
jgi:hypothetical protein